jgi:hypothetical protein
LGGIPDRIPLFHGYSDDAINEVCVNLAGDLFKSWARPSLRQFNPLLTEITKSNANNTKKTIYNKIKKVIRENPNTGYIPVMEVKKKLIEQWGSVVHKNTSSSFLTPSALTNANNPAIIKNVSAPLQNQTAMMMGIPGMQNPLGMQGMSAMDSLMPPPILNPFNPLAPMGGPLFNPMANPMNPMSIIPPPNIWNPLYVAAGALDPSIPSGSAPISSSSQATTPSPTPPETDISKDADSKEVAKAGKAGKAEVDNRRDNEDADNAGNGKCADDSDIATDDDKTEKVRKGRLLVEEGRTEEGEHFRKKLAYPYPLTHAHLYFPFVLFRTRSLA